MISELRYRVPKRRVYYKVQFCASRAHYGSRKKKCGATCNIYPKRDSMMV